MTLTDWTVKGLALAAVLMMAPAGESEAEEARYASDYPGLKARGGAMDIADSQIRVAIEAFQLVYGRNPQSWNEVTSSGLFDNKLVGYEMQQIDPDDSTVDFIGDIYLASSQVGEHAGELQLYNYWNASTDDVDGPLLTNKGSYADRLTELTEEQQLSAEQKEIISAWLADEAQLIQFAHIRQLTYATIAFMEVTGSYPTSVDELIAAGFGPLSSSSVNPVTGEKYRFDGSKGDISYTLMDEGKGFKFGHVDPHRKPQFEFGY